MTRCARCGGTTFRPGEETVARTFDGRAFRCTLRTEVCTTCGVAAVEAKEVARFDREVAEAMARERHPSPDSFRWMSKTLGLRAGELAPMLDVSGETLAAWETSELEVPPLAWMTPATMVLVREKAPGAR